jgi:hypothetical protein
LWSPEGYKIILPSRFYEEAGIQNDEVLSNEAAKGRVLGGYNLMGATDQDFRDTITVTRKHLQGSMAALGNEPSELMQAHVLAHFPHEKGKIGTPSSTCES